MGITSQAEGLSRRLSAAVIVTAAIAVTSIILAPVAAYHRQPHPHVSLNKPRLESASDAFKDCFITDKNGRKWPCSRINNPAANLTSFECPVENRLGATMELFCDDDIMDYRVGTGETEYQSYVSVFDPAPPPRHFTVERTSPKVTCDWSCAGNSMAGVVVWDEQWPEAWSCRKAGGDGRCRLVFESNREVVLVTRAGRRVLGDVAIKECSKNWWGYGRWLPFGVGCTYPKHDHPYYGTVKG